VIKWLNTIALSLLMMGSMGSAVAGEDGWITSVSKAMPEDQVYRINIQRIDGKQPIGQREYRLDAGKHSIRVSLLIETQWAPQLARIVNKQIYSKEMTFTVAPGFTYFLGGKVDPDASDEAQRDGSFWDPVIYRKRSR